MVLQNLKTVQSYAHLMRSNPMEHRTMYQNPNNNVTLTSITMAQTVGNWNMDNLSPARLTSINGPTTNNWNTYNCQNNTSSRDPAADPCSSITPYGSSVDSWLNSALPAPLEPPRYDKASLNSARGGYYLQGSLYQNAKTGFWNVNYSLERARAQPRRYYHCINNNSAACNYQPQLQPRQSDVNCSDYRYDISAPPTTACASSYITDADVCGANTVSPTYNNIVSENLSDNRLNHSSITENNVQSYTTCSEQNAVLSPQLSTTSFTTSPTSTNARSIAAINAASAAADALNGGVLSSLNIRTKTDTEFHGARAEERPSIGESLPSSRLPFATANLNASLLSSLLTTSHINDICGNARTSHDTNDNNGGGNENENNGNNNAENEGNDKLLPNKIEYSPVRQREQLEQLKQQESSVIPGIKLGNTGLVLDTAPVNEELHDIAARNTGAYDGGVGTIIGVSNSYRNYSKQPICAGGSSSVYFVPHSSDTISPTADIVTEMKYETQTGPPTTPSHLTSSGVEPPHSSQGTGIVVGGSPAEVVDSLLLSPWSAGQDFLEPPDVKQTATGLQDAWDSLLLGSTVGSVASAQSLAELKPLPPFTGYTGHLSINGIPGHHYHTIASSGQRSSIPSASPTPSSNQEYYESPVVSSSTPCPQGSQKQQQQQQQNHQPQHQQQQQQQQLPQSTQQVDYDIEDIAEIIGSAIADTTVPGSGNGPSSEQDTESRAWSDFDDWINTVSPRTQETTVPSTYSNQIYVTTTPSTPAQQHGSTLQSLLTHTYAPLLQARLQAGNAAGLQNASCGETPSSTSPYPISPSNQVSTSCSPEQQRQVHSSLAAPSHIRKRSRSSPASGQNPSKKGPAAGAAALSYGTESNLIGKEKPVHRCQICNRGFLNKSNIKVHLRTHTGEKPFRCEVCGKSFRQKAHLIKHQQIHKRIGRD